MAPYIFAVIKIIRYLKLEEVKYMDKIIFFDFSLYNILCLFILYSFLGWCLEVAYAAVNTGKFVNRGFLNGPAQFMGLVLL